MAVRAGSIFIFLSIAFAASREIQNQFQDGQTFDCPDGWRQIRDRCLYFSADHGETAENWNDAKDICMLYSLYLVSIRDITDLHQIYGKQNTGLHCGEAANTNSNLCPIHLIFEVF